MWCRPDKNSTTLCHCLRNINALPCIEVVLQVRTLTINKRCERQNDSKQTVVDVAKDKVLMEESVSSRKLEFIDFLKTIAFKFLASYLYTN